jgi:hypothetical protein
MIWENRNIRHPSGVGEWIKTNFGNAVKFKGRKSGAGVYISKEDHLIFFLPRSIPPLLKFPQPDKSTPKSML